MSTFKYKAFVSYSWKDRPGAEALHRALEAYRAPKTLGPLAAERLAPIFRDRDEEAAGASLKAAIEDALDRSEFLIVVCSPNSAQSPWVNKEIAYFRKKRTPANVLCYVLAGDPGPAVFPPALLFESSVDGEMSATPIEAPLAADAREEGDGERLARLKLAAAMLGVGLDDLVRRDAQRRARRTRAALAGAFGVAAAMTAVAAYAVVQRDAARDSERRAQREAMKAERTAEFMVSLFEVADPGESRGATITAREILDRGVASIEKDLAEAPDVQASLMHTMGRVYTGLGLYPDAARILSSARDKRVAAKADPEDLYATENALARAEFEKGDLDAAKKIYARLVATAEADLAKGLWRVDYATAMIGMGETTLYADTPEEAQKHYERAIDLLKSNGMDETEEMAEALRGLGGASMDRRNYRLAEESLDESRKILSSLYGSDDFRVALILNDLGNLFYLMKEPGRAEDAFERALFVYKTILGDMHPDTIIMENNYARMAFESGDLTSAKYMLISIINKIDEIDRLDHFDFSYTFNTLGEVQIDLREYKDAENQIDSALRLAEGGHNRIYGSIMLNKARLACVKGKIAEGVELIKYGRRALDRHYSKDDWRYGVADEIESQCAYAHREINASRRLAVTAEKKLVAQLGPYHYFSRRAGAWAQSAGK